MTSKKDQANGFFPTESEIVCPWKKECFEFHFLEIDKMKFKITPEIAEALDWCFRKQIRVKVRTATIFQAVKAIKQTVTGKKDSYHLKGKTRTHRLDGLSSSTEDNQDLAFILKVLSNLYELIAKTDANTKELYRMVKEFKKLLKSVPK